MWAVMHAWLFRHLDQLRPIYEREFQALEAESSTGLRPAPGTARRIPGTRDVAVAPMRAPKDASKGRRMGGPDEALQS